MRPLEPRPGDILRCFHDLGIPGASSLDAGDEQSSGRVQHAEILRYKL